MSEMIEIPVDGGSMEACFAAPSDPGPHPGAIVMFHCHGIDTFTEDIVDRPAGLGYVTASPKFYHRRPKDEVYDERMKHRDDGEIVDDINTAVAFLQACPDVQADNFAIIGHCGGGRLVCLGACTNPVFKAAAAYYGGNMFTQWGEGQPTPFERLNDLNCPLMGFYAGLDPNPSPEDVDRIDAELNRLANRTNSTAMRARCTRCRTI